VSWEKRVDTVAKSVAQELEATRLKLGLSLNQVGEKTGLAHQTIMYIESGKRKPTLDSLIRITDAYGIELSKLIKNAEKRLNS